MSVPFITEPSSSRLLDRGLRALAYLSQALFALALLSGDPHLFAPNPHWAQWWAMLLVSGLLVSSMAGVVSCALGRGQAEMVLLPVLLGSLASVIILVSVTGGPVLPHIAIMGTALAMFTVRLHWLYWASRRARVVHELGMKE